MCLLVRDMSQSLVNLLSILRGALIWIGLCSHFPHIVAEASLIFHPDPLIPRVIITTVANMLPHDAIALRRILVEQARHKQTQKAGGQWQRVTLSTVEPLDEGPRLDLLALDEALAKLEAKDRRKAQLVKLRFFAGLTNVLTRIGRPPPRLRNRPTVYLTPSPELMHACRKDTNHLRVFFGHPPVIRTQANRRGRCDRGR
jgi:hypothetical protein